MQRRFYSLCFGFFTTAFLLLGCGEGYDSKYADLGKSSFGSKQPDTPPDPNGGGNTTNNAITDPSDPCYLPLDYQTAEILSQIQAACQFTNMEREQGGLPPLELELVHSQVAQGHAEDMVINNFFNHRDPDGNTFRDRLIAEGVIFDFGGENLAYGVPQAIEVINLWMTSGPHRQNIMNSRHTKIGIGYYQTYWVQVFTD